MTEVCAKSAHEAGGKVIVSVTDHATEVAVKRAKYFEEKRCGLHYDLTAVLFKTGAKYLYEHMKAIADAVKIPIMAQYAPEQTGVAISPETFCRLEKECPNMIYYKIECKPAGPYVTNLMNLTDGKMKILSAMRGFSLSSVWTEAQSAQCRAVQCMTYILTFTVNTRRASAVRR